MAHRRECDHGFVGVRVVRGRVYYGRDESVVEGADFYGVDFGLATV